MPALAAIAHIDDTIRENSIDAGFEWVDGYLHAPIRRRECEEMDSKRKHASPLIWASMRSTSSRVRSSSGLACASRTRPVFIRGSTLRAWPKPSWDSAAKIHEHAEAGEFCDGPRAVSQTVTTVTCEDIVIATHNPLVGLEGMTAATLFQTKLALYTSYVVAGRVEKGRIADALWVGYVESVSLPSRGTASRLRRP
jgi:hypothetical protein